jgi:hypothetical protein
VVRGRFPNRCCSEGRRGPSVVRHPAPVR